MEAYTYMIRRMQANCTVAANLMRRNHHHRSPAKSNVNNRHQQRQEKQKQDPRVCLQIKRRSKQIASTNERSYESPPPRCSFFPSFSFLSVAMAREQTSERGEEEAPGPGPMAFCLF
ncbi:hypothetical protein O6H91_06G072300 [Diphasiastrum complanatum]|uniref:Uncharacterized protein n=1 Tax=Diphasiastrum complanatum TaxID=34168 RepID=A0ACC2DEZ8_DIPCM|nr:hypothetical protein O6H91_06G072300 [Diphasiastrum complanatum]